MQIYNTELYKQHLLDLGITTITLADEYTTSGSLLRHHCSVCGGYYMARPSNVTRGRKCPYCTGKKVLTGFNDIATVAPEIAKHIKNPEDARTHSLGSNKNIEWRCAYCGAERVTMPNKMSKGYVCHSCSDGISFPEKFLNRILADNGINYIYQLTSAKKPWCKNYHYDFYFEIGSDFFIVETNGCQHYTKSFNQTDARTLEEEQENDRKKRDLALENGINHYVVLDCSLSDGQYIWTSIMHSDLANVIDPKTDWQKFEKGLLPSYLIETCKLYSSGVPFMEVCEKLQLSPSCVTTYLKRGDRLGLCNFEEMRKANRECAKQVVCLDTQTKYYSIEDAAKDMNVCSSAISRCCKGQSYVAISRTGRPTHWIFANKYDSSADYSDILRHEKIITNRNRPVMCLNTGEVFESIVAASRWAKCRTISDVLLGRQSTAGKHPVTKERLRWKYAEVES